MQKLNQTYKINLSLNPTDTKKKYVTFEDRNAIVLWCHFEIQVS